MFKKIFAILSISLGFVNLSNIAMDKKTPEVDTFIYVKNSSDYPVRISAGPEYPSSIALYPGQIIEFPLRKVSAMTASTYGRISHYLTGLVAELNIIKLLEESPEYATKDCFVNITYEKDSGPKSIWSFARYLFTQGKWALALSPVEHEKDLAGYVSNGSYSEALYSMIAKGSDSTPEPIARDAALIWSMFPRAASKIEAKQIVYPFNILGLDIGGLIATDTQLRNWGALLSSSLRKRYSAISNPAIWAAVNMIIADSVEAFRLRNYYVDRDPHYPVTLLYIPTPDSPEVQQEPSFPEDIIDQLKDKVSGDTAAQALIGQLEQAARVRGWTGLIKTAPQVMPPQPPPLPGQGASTSQSYQERGVINFLRGLEQKRPEEQVLLDKVALELFKKIDELGLEQQEAMKLKYAALDKLRLIEQGKHAVSDFSKIRDFLSPVMIRLARTEKNPPQAIQDWLSFLTRLEREKAYEYYRMDEQPLSQAYHEQLKQRDDLDLLMAFLKQQIKRFGSTDDL